MLKNGLGSLHEKQAVAARAGVVAALEGGLLSLSRLAQRVAIFIQVRHVGIPVIFRRITMV
jgi:hypothetical protein